MTSHFRSILAVSGALAAAAAFQPALHAQGFGGMFSGLQMNGDSEEEESSTVITASAADIDLENNIIVLIGDVVVDDDTNKITCNKMTIYLEEDSADSIVGSADKPKEDNRPAAASPLETAEEDDEDDDAPKKNISKIVCVGDVVFIKRAKSDNPRAQDQIAMSDQAEYDAVKEEIVMTGDPGAGEEHRPVMMQGANKMYGDEIRIIIREGNRMRVINPKVYYTGDSLLSGGSKTGSNR